MLCAIKELSLLGVRVDPVYLAQRKATLAARNRRDPKHPAAEPSSNGYGVEWDENFAYIAGQTEAGFPFGVTWEESAEGEAGSEGGNRPPKIIEDDDF